MNALLTPPPVPAAAASEIIASSRPEAAANLFRLLLRLARGLQSWLLAALSCLTIPFALVFSGWTYRLVQRRALTHWAKRLGQQPPTERLLPRWFLSEHFRDDLATARGRSPLAWLRAFLRPFLRSFAANLRTGFLVVLNSMLVTLPGGMIMMFSWYAGWNVSFHKDYEQAAIGPLWGFAGIFLFIAAMTYVPLAQARQAVTGSAMAFWNYRRVRDVIHRRPLASLLLVVGYAVLGLAVMAATSALQFVGNIDGFAELDAAQIVTFLNRYYFWSALLLIVPGFLALKLLAGRIYAAAAWDAVTDGSWRIDDLRGAEREALAKAPVAPSATPLTGLMHTSLRAFSMIGRLTLRTATFLVLLSFAIQLYVAQFISFEPAATWLRQPMVQLPWFRSLPPPAPE